MGGAQTGREEGTDKRKKGRLGYVIGRDFGAGPKGGPEGPRRERRGGETFQPTDTRVCVLSTVPGKGAPVF